MASQAPAKQWQADKSGTAFMGRMLARWAVGVLAALCTVPVVAGCSSTSDPALGRYRAERALGLKAEQSGDLQGAETHYRQALALAGASWGPEHANCAQSLSDLGWLFYKQGQYAKAEILFRKALRIRTKVFGPDDLVVADTLTWLAASLDKENRSGEAETYYRQALAVREKSLDPDHPDVAQSIEQLAACYWRQHKAVEAEPLMKRVLALKEKNPDTPPLELVTTLNNLGAIYFLQKKYALAEDAYKRALSAQERLLGAESPALSTTLESYAKVMWQAGRAKEAESLELRARALRAASIDPRQKERFDQFARKVTHHLLDLNYKTYEASQAALATGELAPSALVQLQKRSLLAASVEELESRARSLESLRQESDVTIDEVKQEEPTRLGFVPVEVKGALFVKQPGGKRKESSQPFEIKLFIGIDVRKNQPVIAAVDKVAVEDEPWKSIVPVAPPAVKK